MGNRGNPAWHGQPGQRWRHVKPCPSEAAYRRHLRHGEVPCDDCYAEMTRVSRARRAAGEVADRVQPPPG